MTRRIRRRRPRVSSRRRRQQFGGNLDFDKNVFGSLRRSSRSLGEAMGLFALYGLHKMKKSTTKRWQDKRVYKTTYFHVSMKTTMMTRVRRRRPRVPPRKGRQPLPQFGAGFAWADDVQLRALNSLLKLSGEKQIGGRLTPRQMKTLMRATDPRRLGIFPKRAQRGAGLFSRLASKLAGRMAAKAAGKVAKAAAKRAAKKMAAKMTKQVAKKVAKKAAMGAVAGAAGWGATKVLDKTKI